MELLFAKCELSVADVVTRLLELAKQGQYKGRKHNFEQGNREISFHRRNKAEARGLALWRTQPLVATLVMVSRRQQS